MPGNSSLVFGEIVLVLVLVLEVSGFTRECVFDYEYDNEYEYEEWRLPGKARKKGDGFVPGGPGGGSQALRHFRSSGAKEKRS